jgi:hypothetical protein
MTPVEETRAWRAFHSSEKAKHAANTMQTIAADRKWRKKKE